MARETHYSEIAEFLRCPYRWHLKYIRGWEDQSFIEKRDLGSAVHVGIEAALRMQVHAKQPGLFDDNDLATPDDAIGTWRDETMRKLRKLSTLLGPDVTEAWEEDTAEIAFQALRIVHRWEDWMDWNRFGTHIHNDVPMIEWQFRYMVTEDIELVGTVDWVCYDERRGGLYVTDWKTRTQITSPESEQWNIQKAIYQYVLRQLHIDVSGAQLLQMRSSDPALPKVNKNNTISRQNIMTDWETYARVCEENGQDPEDYLDMKQKLDARVWFEWTPILRHQEELNGWMEWALNVVDEMVIEVAHRNPSPMKCTTCWARSICLEELRGRTIEDLGGMGLSKREESK